MIKIKLDWPDKTLQFWSGNKFGRLVYKEQVAPKLSTNEVDDVIELIFPAQIIFLNFSFVQGLFSELLPRIGGVSNFKKYIKISSENSNHSDEIQKMIWDKLRIR
ncbi:hypothetical protein [Leuconostoc mesenteroides]|uniref:hypothetical protein n=1 Tax=Leuconostoc mesenteroides TaxID=1245 RepID=UPI0005A8AD77|nr:hypothetical protein [Leuconostoc mesenteroides]KAA8365982.1 hypothetical protein FE417_07665 [Leuconostoc mesenteroides]MDM7539079.1 hypothetical protein [Leuconostoc mesenteroides]